MRTSERSGAVAAQTVARRRARQFEPGPLWTLVTVMLGLAISPVPCRAQTTGQILGRVIDAETRAPVSTADVWIEGLEIRALSSERGNFLLTGVPVGEHRLRAQRIGFRTAVVPVRVRGGRTTQVTFQLTAAPVELEEVAAEVERAHLIEPEVVVTHEVMLGRELRELPLDEIKDAVELATGVSDGHFRGGRLGQESYRIDGLEVRNQLEAARQAPGLELSPTAVAEIEVVTGGMGADNGSALSGVVGYVTRRGNADRWEGRLALSSDHWVPDDLFRGFSSLSASLGGPLRFLGRGSAIFADVLAQGLIDADPRARGLTCLRTEDADADLADAINALRDNRGTEHLYCPFTAPRLPFQRGDKLIGFVRIDRPLAPTSNLTLSLLHNRRQRELYTPEFKYNPDFQLGQRTKAYLASLALDWTRHREGRAYRVTARAAAMRLDRYLGVLDPWTFDERTRIAGFGFADFRFLGEGSARKPIDQQLESGGA
ncbi:MAG: TonB-dependent receptor, partial [Gemmatimonadota bacterium]